MDWIQVVVVAVVQGLTEFLPISSSAHLILVPLLLEWPDQGLVFDVAVHLGSLIAVVVYFRYEVLKLLGAWISATAGRGHTADSKLAWWVIVGTIPAVVVGFLSSDFIETNLRSGWVIAVTTIVFGILLGWSDLVARKQKNEFDLSFKDVLFIGLAQAVALIPGTSRSGITMTAALFLGLSRSAAARFSFLLSMPIILASSILQLHELMTSNLLIDWLALSLAIVLSTLSAGLCIHLFLRLIDKIGMMPFVIYRLLLGGFLIYFLW
ncbi:MAG: undecaprenyl-diphosphatase [Gammaproteobacteria bacterium]|jgi:undecaprenyl-diphosphatase